MSVPPAVNLPLSLSLSSPRSSTSSAVPSALPLTPSLDDPTLSAKVEGEGDGEGQGEGEDEGGVRVELELSDQSDLHSFPFQRTSTCSSSSSSQEYMSPITTSKVAYDPIDTLPSQFASFSFHATHVTHPHPHSAPASAGGVSSPSGSPRKPLAKPFPSPTSGGDAFVFGTCPSAPLSATPTTELGQFEYPSPPLDRVRSWGSQSSGHGSGHGNGNGVGAGAGPGSISARSSVSYSGRAVPLGESHRHASIIARPTDRHREPATPAHDAHAPPSPPAARRSSTCSTITTLPASGRRPSILHSATTGSGSALPKSASTSPATAHSPLPAVGTGETSTSPSSPTTGTTATLPSAAQLSTRRGSLMFQPNLLPCPVPPSLLNRRGSLPAAQLFGLPSDQLAQLALQRASISGTYVANIAPTSTTSHALYHRRDSLISDGGTSSGGSSRTVVAEGQGEGAGSGVPTRRSSFKAPRPVFEDWMAQGRRASLPFLPSLPTHGPLATGKLPSSPLHGNGQGQAYGTEGSLASRRVSQTSASQSQSQSQSPRLTLAERRARHSLDHGHAQTHGHTHSHGRSRTQAEGIVPNAGVISSSEESVDEDLNHGGVNRTSPRSKAGRRSKVGHQRHVQETEPLELSLDDDADGDGVERSGEETTVTDEVESLPTPGDGLDVLGGPAWSGSDPWASAGASAASAASAAASGETVPAGGDVYPSGLGIGLGPAGSTHGVVPIPSNSIPPFDTIEAGDSLGLAEDGFAITGKPKSFEMGTNQNLNHPAAILASGVGIGISRKTSLRDGRPGVAERPGLATIPSDSTERAE